MNLTSQYIVNSKSIYAYTNSLATYKSIRTTSTRLRISDDRCISKPSRNIYFKIDEIYFKMILCPRGDFMMGSDNKDENNPKRLITIERPFLLGEVEVTQELFQVVMEYNPSRFQGEKYPNLNQRPVENVTWYDAVIFCNKLSLKLGKRPYYNISSIKYAKKGRTTLQNVESAKVTIDPHSNGFRLPYEKEWEYAAKAGTDNQWAGTNDENQLKEIAWFNDNSKIKGVFQTHPVKSKRQNEWGFYDMSGNVQEWCYDSKSWLIFNEDIHVCRGGDFLNGKDDLYLRSANRSRSKLPSSRNNGLGFRVASSLVN